MIEEIPPNTTAPGSCHRCGKWSRTAQVVAEIHGDSGAGGTVVRCPNGCPEPVVRRGARTRTYSL